MNGRIYDPTLGRFLQADPFIQAPYNTQSLNRYSYVINNPLNATDPNGYFFKKIIGIVVAVVGTAICGPECGKLGYTLIGAAAGGTSAAVNGGNILQGIVTGGISGAALSAVGASGTFGYSLGDGAGQLAMNALGNGVVGGITNILSGGKFGHGFIAAGLSAFGKPGIRKAFGTGAGALPWRVGARAILGGTISTMTGGKFANGAATAAFSQLFNEEATLARERVAQKRACAGRPCVNRDNGSPSLREQHYARNASNVDVGIMDVLNTDEWVLLSDAESVYHRQGPGNENNLKFVSADGNMEAVFYPSGVLVTDPVNLGTYNFYGPRPWYSSGLLHLGADVAPYLLWGNSANDPTPWQYRVHPSFGEKYDSFFSD